MGSMVFLGAKHPGIFRELKRLLKKFVVGCSSVKICNGLTENRKETLSS